MMFELTASDFSLQDTLASGQAFRWKGRGAGYEGCVGHAIVRVRQENDQLLCESSEHSFGPEQLRHYFALDLDLRPILSSIDVDVQIHQAILRHRGLRVMRQDTWETLASFICASFNNIKRIEGMIERLCQVYGEMISFDGSRYFDFPSPERLAGIPEYRLRRLGLGYRAAYIRQTARLVSDGKLSFDQLRHVPYETARSALLCCQGVGEKVADCVALFGCEKYEAFPIDIWMTRAMRYYFRHRRMTIKKLHQYARWHFGSYAGYAQQYLYHDIRTRRETAS